MKVSGVQTQQLLSCDRIAKIEFMRTDNVTLRSKPEQLAFNGIEVQAGINLLGKDGIERFSQPLARKLATGGRVFVAIGDPNIRYARTSLSCAHHRADLAASDAVINPILSNPRIGMGQRKAIVCLCVCEVGRIEIQFDALVLRPIDPPLKVLWTRI